MSQYRGPLSKVQSCSSRTPSSPTVWNGAVLGSLILMTSRSGCHRQAQHLAYVALLFPGLQLPPLWQRGGSWVISLTQHWLVLICLNCSLIQVSELSMAHLCSGALELLGLSEISHPGGALDTWALSAQCTVWVLGCSQCLFSSMNDSSEGLCAL